MRDNRRSSEFDGDGVVTGGEPGAWRAHFAYDALGRLVSKQVPWGSLGNDERWCWYYYDGVRRIVEVFRDPLVTGGGIGGGPPSGGSYTTYTDREYVWGPDYVDECLWQVDKVGDVAFVLQDGNYNVVGLVDEEGALLRQYAWDPYGQPIAVDDLGTFGHNRLGHQGLFFDRLDANAPNADLTATARGVYYARNRPYAPHIGRWMTSDPNGTGTAVVGSIILHGGQCDTSINAFNGAQLLRDGANLYAYLGAAPAGKVDPLGLFFSFGDMGAATEIATDLQIDTFDMGLDVLDSLLDAFGIDDGNALGYVRAGVFFGGFAKGGFGGGARRGVGDVPASSLFADPSKFQKAFDKHARDFGVSGSRNFDNMKLFERTAYPGTSSIAARMRLHG
ncbi:MAG: hypothetical protein KJZ54_15760, partial [Phycisphaerales bacterium]|nr:hypothetical protein [Phycisphaerales bacterium]